MDETIEVNRVEKSSWRFQHTWTRGCSPRSRPPGASRLQRQLASCSTTRAGVCGRYNNKFATISNKYNTHCVRWSYLLLLFSKQKSYIVPNRNQWIGFGHSYNEILENEILRVLLYSKSNSLHHDLWWMCVKSDHFSVVNTTFRLGQRQLILQRSHLQS